MKEIGEVTKKGKGKEVDKGERAKGGGERRKMKEERESRKK